MSSRKGQASYKCLASYNAVPCDGATAAPQYGHYYVPTWNHVPDIDTLSTGTCSDYQSVLNAYGVCKDDLRFKKVDCGQGELGETHTAGNSCSSCSTCQ